jgi:hypothetical protein
MMPQWEHIYIYTFSNIMSNSLNAQSSPLHPNNPENESSFVKELKSCLKLLDTVMSNFSTIVKKCHHSQPLPVGLEQPFNELYSLLHPCLVDHNKKSNVVALVMGKRGTGKTLLVEHTLATLQQETMCPFCVVCLNGLAIHGNDVGYAVKEII